MQEILSLLDQQLSIHAPALAATLRVGASESMLNTFEGEIGQRLPPDVRAAYQWHNGCDYEQSGNNRTIGLFGRHQWCPIEKVIELWDENNHNFDSNDPYFYDEDQWDNLPLRPWTSTPPSWIPIGLIPSYQSCTISIDMLPGPSGKVGQIVAESIHAMSKGIFANNIYDYFFSLAKGLRSGSIIVITNPDTQDQYWGYTSGNRFLAPGDRDVFG
jgi:cell wall assembly regulator SMI1